MTDDSRSRDARSGGIKLLTVVQGQTSAFIEKRIVAGPDSLVALAGTFPQRLDMEDFDFSTRVSDHASALKSMRDRADARPLNTEHFRQKFLRAGRWSLPARSRARNSRRANRASM